jgi:hypothetical protein
MADLQALIQAVDELNADELKQLYNHIVETRMQFIDAHQTLTVPTLRVLGLHEHLGQAWMSDDFNDELPQEFWLGEDV